MCCLQQSKHYTCIDARRAFASAKKSFAYALKHPTTIRNHTKKAVLKKKTALSWATWIRTKNDRTRICSVTITP